MYLPLKFYIKSFSGVQTMLLWLSILTGLLENRLGLSSCFDHSLLPQKHEKLIMSSFRFVEESSEES